MMLGDIQMTRTKENGKSCEQDRHIEAGVDGGLGDGRHGAI